MNGSIAILLVGHGTRDAAGAAKFFELADLLAARVAPSSVFPCFLELAEPPIDVAVRRAIAAGVERIVVMPLLLFAAGHAKRDIPAAVDAAIRGASVESDRNISWRQAGVLACHPKLIELSARRFAEAVSAEAVASTSPATEEETCLILVGRGSHDGAAVAEMHRFAHLRCEATPVGRCDVAFLAMAEPKYADVLLAAAQRGHRRIVVQPHLLFEGELLCKLRRDTTSLAERFPASQWVVASCLGPDPLLAEAVEILCRAAMDDPAG